MAHQDRAESVTELPLAIVPFRALIVAPTQAGQRDWVCQEKVTEDLLEMSFFDAFYVGQPAQLSQDSTEVGLVSVADRQVLALAAT